MKLLTILLLFLLGCTTEPEPEDCADVPGGDAELDNCNVCDTDKTNDCVQDCAEEWGGDAVVDECGVCDTDTSIDCIQDCAGVWGGDAVVDECGVCDTDTSIDCIQDCAGVWGGDAVEDECGECGGDGIDDGACDCDGNVDAGCGCGEAGPSGCDETCGSTLENDACGVCGGDGSTCITDIDGNVYLTFQIGDQLWMAENLKVIHYNDGSEIPTDYSNSEWTELETGAYAVYDDDPTNSETYGRLYNWYTVDDDRGVCPEDFHVPSEDEYKELEIFLGIGESEANDTGDRGTDEGSQLAGNSDLWNDGELENNSEFGTSGFNGLPAGYRRNSTATYDTMGNRGYFWSSSEYSSYYAWYRMLHYNRSNVTRFNYYKQSGFSVRCLGD